MARLKPIKETTPNGVITSISVTKEINAQLVKEQKRTGVRSKSELIRLIIEEYFKQPLKSEDEETNDE